MKKGQGRKQIKQQQQKKNILTPKTSTRKCTNTDTNTEEGRQSRLASSLVTGATAAAAAAAAVKASENPGHYPLTGWLVRTPVRLLETAHQRQTRSGGEADTFLCPPTDHNDHHHRGEKVPFFRRYQRYRSPVLGLSMGMIIQRVMRVMRMSILNVSGGNELTG